MKRKRIVQLSIEVIIIIVIAVLAFIQFKSRKHDLPQILESGRLYVLTDSSSIGFCKSGGKVGGFQYEIIKAFADTLGVELVITEESDYEKCIALLKNREYDIIASLIPITNEKKTDLQFTMPLQWSRLMLVQALETDSGFKHHSNVLDLGGDTLVVNIHSPHKYRIAHLSDEIAQPIYVKEVSGKSEEQLVQQLSMRKIGRTICDEKSATVFKRKYPNIDVSLPIGFSQPMGWATHQDSYLLMKELNDFLDDFIGSSTYWEIYRKYY
jgi:membrane-bound lytic murein transglycosylase F